MFDDVVRYLKTDYGSEVLKLWMSHRDCPYHQTIREALSPVWAYWMIVEAGPETAHDPTCVALLWKNAPAHDGA
jgi:hypothetical protein